MFNQKINGEEYIVLGEYFKEADGDLLIFKNDINNEKIYYYAHSFNTVKELADNITELFESKLLSYIEEII